MSHFSRTALRLCWTDELSEVIKTSNDLHYLAWKDSVSPNTIYCSALEVSDVCGRVYVMLLMFYVIISPPPQFLFYQQEKGGKEKKSLSLRVGRKDNFLGIGLECLPRCFCPHDAVKYTLLSIQCLGGHTSACEVDVLTCSNSRPGHKLLNSCFT